MAQTLLIQLVVMTGYAIAWFLIALVLRRNDVADIAWGLGFIVAAAVALLRQDMLTMRTEMVFALVLLWGIRLVLHVYVRNRGKGEDARYRKWREEWGRYATVRAFFQVFLLQSYLVIVIALPVTAAIHVGGPPLALLDAIGLAVFIVGFLFETVGDYQLLKFKGDPANRGRIIQSGLWKYTRHPNYFGEVTLWWGIYLIALSVPGAWITVFGPLTITFLILKVSGIPLLEKKYEGNADFAEYKRRTSAFFPMPPKA